MNALYKTDQKILDKAREDLRRITKSIRFTKSSKSIEKTVKKKKIIHFSPVRAFFGMYQ
jgi:hypothetical protein